MKEVTAHFLRLQWPPDDSYPNAGVWEIRVNGVRVSSVITSMTQDELEAHYHPHAVATRMIEGAELHDTDLEILHAAAE
jgi:hypothetical protein